MALLVNLSKGSILVVVSKDSAVTCDKKGYQDYLDSFESGSGDESHLKLEGEPTRFVLRKVLPYDVKMDIDDRKMKYQGGEMQPRLSFVTEEVRAALVDIKNSSDLPVEQHIEFKKDNDGLAHKDIILALDGIGVVNDLWSARSKATASNETLLKKK